MKVLHTRIAIQLLVLFAVVAVFAVSETKAVTGRAEITPTLMYATLPQFIEPVTDEATFIVGDLQAGSLGAILPSTFRINGTMIPTSVTLLANFPGFTGPVYQLTYPEVDFLQSYLPFYDSTLHNYTITAVCQDAVNFVFPGQVMLRGHMSGDVNTDGRINITDLTFLTTFLFRSGSAPQDLAAADINHNGMVTVSDLSSLVRRLFAS